MTYNHHDCDGHFRIAGILGNTMGCFPVPPQLKGPKGHILAARIEVPILAAMIYGTIEFIRLYYAIPDPKIRRQFLDMAKTVAESFEAKP